MELQFYGPGYVPQFEGFGCTATQYCAAMTIDSLTENQNTRRPRTTRSACNDYVLGGAEPINWAYITRSGRVSGPGEPAVHGHRSTNPNFTAVNPNPGRGPVHEPGRQDPHPPARHARGATRRSDRPHHATAGSMTASVANGFGHILFTPNSTTCQEAPYAFHPEYSTADPRGNTWSAHTYNIAYSDELGHFENCRGDRPERQLHRSRRPGPNPRPGRHRLPPRGRLEPGPH